MRFLLSCLAGCTPVKEKMETECDTHLQSCVLQLSAINYWACTFSHLACYYAYPPYSPVQVPLASTCEVGAPRFQTPTPAATAALQGLPTLVVNSHVCLCRTLLLRLFGGEQHVVMHCCAAALPGLLPQPCFTPSSPQNPCCQCCYQP